MHCYGILFGCRSVLLLQLQRREAIVQTHWVAATEIVLIHHCSGIGCNGLLNALLWISQAQDVDHDVSKSETLLGLLLPLTNLRSIFFLSLIMCLFLTTKDHTGLLHCSVALSKNSATNTDVSSWIMECFKMVCFALHNGDSYRSQRDMTGNL